MDSSGCGCEIFQPGLSPLEQVGIGRKGSLHHLQRGSQTLEAPCCCFSLGLHSHSRSDWSPSGSLPLEQWCSLLPVHWRYQVPPQCASVYSTRLPCSGVGFFGVLFLLLLDFLFVCLVVFWLLLLLLVFFHPGFRAGPNCKMQTWEMHNKGFII